MSELHYGKPKWMRPIYDENVTGIGWEEVSQQKGDLISRDALKTAVERWDMQDLYLPVHFLDLIDDIPSVEPKKGKWEYHSWCFVCPCCETRYGYDGGGSKWTWWEYCPSCGANMRGEENE